MRITASQQIDRVSNTLTRLAQSRALPARDIKPLVLRLDRIANTLDQGPAQRKSGINIHTGQGKIEYLARVLEIYGEEAINDPDFVAKVKALESQYGVPYEEIITMIENQGSRNRGQTIGSRQTASKKKVPGLIRNS